MNEGMLATHRIVHCGSCSVKYRGRSVSQGQFWWPYLLFGASIHLLLWEGSPLPLALNCFASPLNELCIAGWDGPRPSTVLLGTWMPCRSLWSSPVQATPEQWSCSGWSSCPVFDISWASQASLPGWSADQVCCTLCSAILSYSPRHTRKEDVFKTREELSMLNLILAFLQVHGWFLYALPPKKLCLDSQDAASNAVVKMPHCTPVTLQKIRNQLMVSEGTLAAVKPR